jgi:hypothetical protein
MPINVTQERPLEPELRNLKLSLVDMALDSAYPTGGSVGISALIPSMSRVVAMIPINSGGYVYSYVPGADTLIVYRQDGSTGALAQVPNGTNLSGAVVRFLAIGQ